MFCSRHFIFNRRGKMSFQALKFISNYSTIELAAPRPSKPCELYETAIVALNTLQTNASVVKESISRPLSSRLNLIKSEKYLIRSGISLDDLDRLSVIHCSGTKGKGSTCALTESILRAHGYKTGFYSSPHLVSATERIRLSGRPISQNDFAKYFWKVYKALFDAKESPDDMPAYFKFLTLMAFHVFLDEKVDVAIIEVGIGGQYDCTNILRNTKTVGITSLGLEHTNLLGNTLEEIAWQKAGIIKPGSHVFTVQQPNQCLRVIEDRCKEGNAKLFVVPDFSTYRWSSTCPKLTIDNEVQKLNASLALQLSNDWMNRRRGEGLLKNGYTMNTVVTDASREGVEQCFWPGRCQIINYKGMRLFLDGAHTIESLNICVDWYLKATANSKNPRFLVFNMTGYRDSAKMLQILHDKIQFGEAIFVPNIASLKKDSRDNTNMNIPISDQLKRSKDHANLWQTLSSESNSKSTVLNSVVEVFDYLSKKMKDGSKIDVLTTGSLHLIGATLLALEEVDNR